MKSTKNGDNIYEYGPSIILNTGVLKTAYLTTTDKFNRYGVMYLVGEHNKTLIELKKIYGSMKRKYGVTTDKEPWSYDKKMIAVFAHSPKQPPTINWEGARIHPRDIKEGDPVKVNVKPMYYKFKQEANFRTPDGQMNTQTVYKEGIKLMLNGVQLGKMEEEELFDSIEEPQW